MLQHISRPIDNTALSAYMTCPREYFYSMVLHRRGGGRAPALVFGSAWHKALEVHYKTGGDEAAVNEAVIMSWEGHDAAEDYRTLDRVLLDYRKYREKIGVPMKEEEQTLGWPEAPLVEVAANVESGGLIHPYAGLLDRIITMDGLAYVQDHKTTSRLDKHYFRQYELSPQMLGYTHIAKQLLPGVRVVGVQINVSHVLTAKTEFHRQIVTFSPARVEEWTFNTNLWLRKLDADYAQFAEEQAQRPDALPGDGITESFMGHYGDNACSRKYGVCGYAAVCGVAARVRRRVLEQEYEVEEWNPLKANEAEV